MSEQNNKIAYQSVFNEIQISQEMREGLLNMAQTKQEKMKQMRRNNLKKYVAAVAAFIAVFFVASNGVVYAQTGSTWVGQLTVLINGEKIKDGTLEKRTDENGDDYYMVHIGEGTECDENSSLELETEDDTE